MTTTYSTFMKNQMAAGYSWTSKKMGIVLLYRAPAIISPGDDPTNPNAHTAYDTQGLLNQQGFQEVSTVASPTYIPYPGVANQQNAGPDTSVAGITTVVYGADYIPIPNTTGAKQVYCAAALFYVLDTVAGVVNPWVMVTNDAFGAVVYPGFAVTGPPDPNTGTPQRKFFSYSIRGSTVNITPASILRSPGTLNWESARIQHVYLLPQRVNYIPNPSFEAVGNFGWRSDGTMTQTPGGVDSPSNNFMRTTGRVLESIPVPRYPLYRFSAYIRKVTATKVNLGLVPYDSTFQPMGGVHFARQVGNEWPLYTTWTRLDGLIQTSDDASSVVPRIEADGSFDCDLVLLEAGSALNPYWAGDAATGLPGDFSWQLPAHQSYSCWYNNRYQTAARLFGEYKEGQITKLPALVLEWVPTGTTVITHWDRLTDQDTLHPLEDWSAKQYNRVSGYNITSVTFVPAGSPTQVYFNFGAGNAAVAGTMVSSTGAAVAYNLASWTVGQFMGFGVKKTDGQLGAAILLQTTYDAALTALQGVANGYAQAYIIQRIGTTNTPADYVIYNVRLG